MPLAYRQKILHNGTLLPPVVAASQMDIFSTLQNVTLLQGIGASHLQKLASLAVAQHYAPGVTLFHENALHHTFYLVVEGSLALEIHIPRRGTKRVLSVEPGEILAWSSILGNGTMTTSAITTAVTSVIAWPAQQLLTLCETEHEIGFLVMQRIAQALSRRLTATRLQLLDMFAEIEPAR